MELYCKNCLNFGRCSAVGRTVAFAVNHGVCRDFDEVKPLTNAQKIRAMSDEELAKFLYSGKFCDICEESCEECRCNGDCESRLADWLKQPVEEV